MDGWSYLSAESLASDNRWSTLVFLAALHHPKEATERCRKRSQE
jgi:hypothetical protein